MSLSNFDFPVSGVTGTAYRDKMKEAMDALLTTNSAAGDPTITKAGMLQIKTNPAPSLRVRNTADTAWVTLLPDLSQQYGGLSSVISSTAILPTNNTWSGTNVFNGVVSFSAAVSASLPLDLNDSSARLATTSFVDGKASQIANVVANVVANAVVNNLSYFGKSFSDAAYGVYLSGSSVLFTGFPAKAKLAKAFLRVTNTINSYGYPVGREIEMDGPLLSYADDAVILHVPSAIKIFNSNTTQILDITAINQINQSFVYVIKAWY
jgi:hypothetical protein